MNILVCDENLFIYYIISSLRIPIVCERQQDGLHSQTKLSFNAVLSIAEMS